VEITIILNVTVLMVAAALFWAGRPVHVAAEPSDGEINTAFADADIKWRLAKLGSIPISGDAKQFALWLASETNRWRKIIEQSGATEN
jgi:hypothetical protein